MKGGAGFAKNIIFSNINFESADNPIIIDQYYCPHKTCDTKVNFQRNIKMLIKLAINLNC